MSLVPTSIQTTSFSNVVSQAYTEGEYFENGFAQFISGTSGGKSKLFPVFGSTTATFSGDGSDLSAGGSFTPDGVTVSTFDSLTNSETLTYQSIKDNENYIPNALATRLGMNLALLRSNTLFNIVAKAANGRSSSAGQIELTGGPTAGVTSTVTDANYAAAFQAGLVGIRNSGINPKMCVAILNVPFWMSLRNSAAFASRDYIGTSPTMNIENSQMNGDMYYGGIQIRQASQTRMGTNDTSNTGLPADARTDLRYTKGILFAKDALGIYETEAPHGEIVDVPHRQSWLVIARTIFGAKAIQTAGMFTFEDDNA